MRKYVGWIYIEKSEGYKDYFLVHVTREGQEPLVRAMGYGERGAASAVEFFESAQTIAHGAGAGTPQRDEGLNLGPVKLEQTPLGLRVYIEVDKEVKKDADALG